MADDKPDDKKPVEKKAATCPGEYSQFRALWGVGKDRPTALISLENQAKSDNTLKCEQYTCTSAHCEEDAVLLEVMYFDFKGKNKKSVRGKLHKNAKVNGGSVAVAWALIGCFYSDDV